MYHPCGVLSVSPASLALYHSTYSHTLGNEACTPCPNGTYSYTESSAWCTPCPVGFDSAVRARPSSCTRPCGPPCGSSRLQALFFVSGVPAAWVCDLRTQGLPDAIALALCHGRCPRRPVPRRLLLRPWHHLRECATRLGSFVVFLFSHKS